LDGLVSGELTEHEFLALESGGHDLEEKDEFLGPEKGINIPKLQELNLNYMDNIWLSNTHNPKMSLTVFRKLKKLRAHTLTGQKQAYFSLQIHIFNFPDRNILQIEITDLIIFIIKRCEFFEIRNLCDSIFYFLDELAQK